MCGFPPSSLVQRTYHGFFLSLCLTLLTLCPSFIHNDASVPSLLPICVVLFCHVPSVKPQCHLLYQHFIHFRHFAKSYDFVSSCLCSLPCPRFFLLHRSLMTVSNSQLITDINWDSIWVKAVVVHVGNLRKCNEQPKREHLTAATTLFLPRISDLSIGITTRSYTDTSTATFLDPLPLLLLRPFGLSFHKTLTNDRQHEVNIAKNEKEKCHLSRSHPQYVVCIIFLLIFLTGCYTAKPTQTGDKTVSCYLYPVVDGNHMSWEHPPPPFRADLFLITCIDSVPVLPVSMWSYGMPTRKLLEFSVSDVSKLDCFTTQLFS